jgi:hypothetical protein
MNQQALFAAYRCILLKDEPEPILYISKKTATKVVKSTIAATIALGGKQ